MPAYGLDDRPKSPKRDAPRDAQRERDAEGAEPSDFDGSTRSPNQEFMPLRIKVKPAYQPKNAARPSGAGDEGPKRKIYAQTVAVHEGQPAIPPTLFPRGNAPEEVALDAARGAVPAGARSMHNRQTTAESTSWLDTIDESGGSSDSSVHSRSNSIGLRRKHIRTGSGDTEAEFDAALDAAVEAAYDDGYEPASDTENQFRGSEAPAEARQPSVDTSNVRRIVDQARRRAREAEREAALVAAQAQENAAHNVSNGSRAFRADSVELDYRGAEEREEQEILEEMTRDYAFDDLEHDGRAKGPLPRESDSSGFSGRTWGSSIGSMPTSAGTPLSSVAETLSLPPPPKPLPKQPVPSSQPTSTQTRYSAHDSGDSSDMTASLPTPLNGPSQRPLGSAIGVRDRRLSGQQVKTLKIDTNTRPPRSQAAPRTQPVIEMESPALGALFDGGPKSASLLDDLASRQANGATKHLLAVDSTQRVTTPLSGSFSADTTSATSGSGFFEKDRAGRPNPPQGVPPSSPARGASKPSTGHGILRKNFSSSSLKSLRQPSATPPPAEDSPSLWGSRGGQSSSTSRREGLARDVPDLPSTAHLNAGDPTTTPLGSAFLRNDLHTADESLQQAPSDDRPATLEPCPESFLLRPFWLMRTIHQAVAHPKGGYISMRLFVPRDAWRVENVKLKNIDEKVANCDLLTAALLNLSKVDTLDADAVLEEMQAFELLLDQVQGQLVKKLGTEVGVNGSLSLFKALPAPDEGGLHQETLGGKGAGAGSKSYLSSWKKLRSKSSGASGLPSSLGNGTNRDLAREAQSLRSLPMTTSLTSKPVKKGLSRMSGIGPYSHYMASLARLCEAVQVLGTLMSSHAAW